MGIGDFDTPTNVLSTMSGNNEATKILSNYVHYS